jgi:hypothetical protein
MLVDIADLICQSDPQKRTFRQINAAKDHVIPIGAMVETEDGERLFVKLHTRDCDQSPLYSLGLLHDTDEDPIHRMKWYHGFCESGLTLVSFNPLNASEPGGGQ